MIRLVWYARVRGTRVECTELQTTPHQYRCTLTGGKAKLQDGTLWTESSSDADIIATALRKVRDHYPHAKLRVTVCSVCRTGSAPDLPCRHVEDTPHWA